MKNVFLSPQTTRTVHIPVENIKYNRYFRVDFMALYAKRAFRNETKRSSAFIVPNTPLFECV